MFLLLLSVEIYSKGKDFASHEPILFFKNKSLFRRSFVYREAIGSHKRFSAFEKMADNILSLSVS